MTTVRVADRFDVVVTSPIARWRAETFLTKEPGTIAWLDAIQPNDVVYDVGANIGLYTLYAAQQVRPHGIVYAFEPHPANAAALLQNAAANGLTDRIRLLTVALGYPATYAPFYFAQATVGSSGSQAHQPIGEAGRFTPIGTELKRVETLDALIDAGHILPPNAVKVDVDGQEQAVLLGLAKRLRSPDLRLLQVELHPADRREVQAMLRAYGWTAMQRHDTSAVAKAIRQGADPDGLPFNGWFLREAA